MSINPNQQKNLRMKILKLDLISIRKPKLVKL